MITNNYLTYGYSNLTPELPETNAVRVLREYAHALTYCHECGNITLFDFSGAWLCGDDLDRSNASALDDLHNAAITHKHGDKLCVLVEYDHDDDDLRALDDLLNAHDSFLDYGVLDEEDYFNREYETWVHSVESAHDHVTGVFLSDRGDEWRAYFDDYIAEFRGYAEPSYVAVEWIERAVEYATSRLALVVV